MHVIFCNLYNKNVNINKLTKRIYFLLVLFLSKHYLMKIFFFVVVLFSALVMQAQNFIPINEQSKLHFVIKNIGIKTGGDIAGMKGKIKFDAKKPSSCLFDVTVNVNTIDTDNGQRDGHLKKDDYFDAEKFPTIRLVSTEIKQGSDLKNFIFKGNLTIKNVTKSLEFPFTAESKGGGANFAGDFEINRIEYGVGNKSMALSNKVIVSLKVFAKAN